MKKKIILCLLSVMSLASCAIGDSSLTNSSLFSSSYSSVNSSSNSTLNSSSSTISSNKEDSSLSESLSSESPSVSDSSISVNTSSNIDSEISSSISSESTTIESSSSEEIKEDINNHDQVKVNQLVSVQTNDKFNNSFTDSSFQEKKSVVINDINSHLTSAKTAFKDNYYGNVNRLNIVCEEGYEFAFMLINGVFFSFKEKEYFLIQQENVIDVYTKKVDQHSLVYVDPHGVLLNYQFLEEGEKGAKYIYPEIEGYHLEDDEDDINDNEEDTLIQPKYIKDGQAKVYIQGVEQNLQTSYGEIIDLDFSKIQSDKLFDYIKMNGETITKSKKLSIRPYYDLYFEPVFSDIPQLSKPLISLFSEVLSYNQSLNFKGIFSESSLKVGAIEFGIISKNKLDDTMLNSNIVSDFNYDEKTNEFSLSLPLEKQSTYYQAYLVTKNIDNDNTIFDVYFSNTYSFIK